MAQSLSSFNDRMDDCEVPEVNPVKDANRSRRLLGGLGRREFF